MLLESASRAILAEPQPFRCESHVSVIMNLASEDPRLGGANKTHRILPEPGVHSRRHARLFSAALATTPPKECVIRPHRGEAAVLWWRWQLALLVDAIASSMNSASEFACVLTVSSFGL